MKKLFVLTAALLAALFVVGCATKKQTGPTAADQMAAAKNDAPSGTLVGQATAPKDVSRAENNAKSQIVRGLNSIVGSLIDDQVASGRLSSNVSSDFKGKISTALSRASLSMDKVGSGVAGDTAWAVYSLDKSEALKAITIAVNAAKEDVAAGNFNLDAFETKFNTALQKEWKN